MGSIGGVYLNFALWALAVFPAWLVVREVGVSLGDRKVERDYAGILPASSPDLTEESKVLK
jgi:hypothetical protein